jgi:hypothetical protein
LRGDQGEGEGKLSNVIAVYEFSGTGFNFPGFQFPSPATSNWLANALNPDRFTWQQVGYPGWVYPMETSINTGVSMMADLITSTTTDFVLVGISQGADVISNVYDELRTGALTAYRSRLRAGVTFGNPRRQAGHTFPGCADPGGAGINSDQLTKTEPLWWDFANPADPAACAGNATTGGPAVGAVLNNIWDYLNQTADPTPSGLTSFIENLGVDLQAGLAAVSEIITQVFIPSGAHNAYWTTSQPLAPSNTTVASQLAINHINSLA